jgi:hypothetical protein
VLFFGLLCVRSRKEVFKMSPLNTNHFAGVNKHYGFYQAGILIFLLQACFISNYNNDCSYFSSHLYVMESSK